MSGRVALRDALDAHGQRLFDRNRSVRRGNVSKLNPLTIDVHEYDQPLTLDDDFELSQWMQVYQGAVGLQIGDLVLLHQEQHDWTLVDVVSDSDVTRARPGLPSGPAGGDLGGRYPNPVVNGRLGFGADAAGPYINGPGKTYTNAFKGPGGTLGAVDQRRTRYFRTTAVDANPRRLWLFEKTRDKVNWEAGGPITVKVWTTYWLGGYSESVMTSGYADGSGGAPRLDAVGQNGARPLLPLLTAETLVSGNIYWTGLYLDLPAWTECIVEVEYSGTEAQSFAGMNAGGQINFDGTEQANTGTGASLVSPSGPVPGGSAGGDLGGTYPNPRLANTPTARADLGLGSAAVQPASAFVWTTIPQATMGRPYKVYRSGNYAAPGSGWLAIAWDVMDLDGSNAENMYQGGVWVAPATGFYLFQFHCMIQNAVGGNIEAAVGYNSGGRYNRAAIANTYYYGTTYSETFYMGAGGTVQPTLWLSAVGGFGVTIQGGTWSSFQRVG